MLTKNQGELSARSQQNCNICVATKVWRSANTREKR